MVLQIPGVLRFCPGKSHAAIVYTLRSDCKRCLTFCRSKFMSVRGCSACIRVDGRCHPARADRVGCKVALFSLTLTTFVWLGERKVCGVCPPSRCRGAHIGRSNSADLALNRVVASCMNRLQRIPALAWGFDSAICALLGTGSRSETTCQCHHKHSDWFSFELPERTLRPTLSNAHAFNN